MTPAALRLAKIRDSFTRDESGRDVAARKAVAGVVEAAKEAGLTVETKGIIHGIRIGTTTMINARLSAEAGQVLLGEDLKTIDDWEYDPLAKEFRGPKGESAVDWLAEKVGKLLESKIKKSER